MADTPGARNRRGVSSTVGSVDGYKTLDVGLIVDNIVADKYGRDKIANHLLLIGNIVSIIK